MGDLLNPKEALEHVERAHQSLESSADSSLRFVPIIAAILAVSAALAGLYANRLTEAALGLKNEAVLAQGGASDAWSEYEAESLKRHLFEIAAQTSPGAAKKRFALQSFKYGREQTRLRQDAKRREAERDRALRSSEYVESRKAIFDGAIAFYEIAIVMTSIAAMVRNRPLLGFALVTGVIALLLTIYGLLR